MRATGLADLSRLKPMDEQQRPFPSSDNRRSGSVNIMVALATASARAEATVTAHRTVDLPAITLKVLILPGERTGEGVLIEAVAVPWFEILDYFHRYPVSIYELILANGRRLLQAPIRERGTKENSHPIGGDKGRDVVATKLGVGSARFFDQVEAYGPCNLATKRSAQCWA
jgi:hypothetical protein